MARFLAYERATTKIKEINTTTGITGDVGTVIAGLDTTNVWDNRSRNLVVVFRGDYYLIARTAANLISGHRWDGAAMTVVLGPSGPFVGATQHPCAFHVVNDRAVAFFVQVNGTSDALVAGVSTDGITWTPALLAGLTGTFASSTTAASIMWRQAVFLSLANGLYIFVPSTATWSPITPYNGGGPLANTSSVAGSFAAWNNDLYFLRPNDGVLGPLLYKLDPTWTIADIALAPVIWTNQTATGFPAVGQLALAVDGGNYCLFRNKVDELAAIISGAGGTFLVKTDVATYPAFVDVTATMLPATISALVNAGASLYEDDRRRTNQHQFFIVRDTVTPGGITYILQWDGVTVMKILATFVGFNIMPPNDPKADYRTYTAKQPSIEFDPATQPSQPFPGRVLLPYIVKEASSRLVDISAEYSEDGDEWLVMTEASAGSDGITSLLTSPTGVAHTFAWDAFVDLDGDKSNLQMRIVPRISGV